MTLMAVVLLLVSVVLLLACARIERLQYELRLLRQDLDITEEEKTS